VANSLYIQSLRKAIRDLHGCDSRHVESVPVHEVFRGESVWRGEVEVFDLAGHPKARRCYAWGERKTPDDPGAQFITVLELPPVQDAQSAVRVAIVAQAKGEK
jgi:hypothetical protein